MPASSCDTDEGRYSAPRALCATRSKRICLHIALSHLRTGKMTLYHILYHAPCASSLAILAQHSLHISSSPRGTTSLTLLIFASPPRQHNALPSYSSAARRRTAQATRAALSILFRTCCRCRAEGHRISASSRTTALGRAGTRKKRAAM